MNVWNKTFKSNHLPLWATKRIRFNAINDGVWFPYSRHENLLPRNLFDHWGSIKAGGVRRIITQPYDNHDQEARWWAEKMGCKLESFKPGPWGEGTTCYIFIPIGVKP